MNEKGEKVSNVDRQPSIPTLLWQPDKSVPDKFELQVPQDVPVGKYHLELLMYQADTDTNALLLDQSLNPQEEVKLGEIQIR